MALKTTKGRRTAQRVAKRKQPASDHNEAPIEEFEREGMGVAPKE